MGLIEELSRAGIESSAVCHIAGSIAEQQRLSDAVQGRIVFVPLYLWHRKIRSAWWKRPALEALQLWKTGWRLRSRTAIIRAARAFRADLVHTNTILTPDSAWAAHRLGLPHVWHVRELVGPGRPFRLPYEGHALGCYLTQRASIVVANSSATHDVLEPHLSSARLACVVNGINIDAFVRAPRAVRVGPPVVGMVANLTARWKKHAVFISAAARVSVVTPATFCIYGHDPGSANDPYSEKLHDLVLKAGLDDRFGWRGFVDNPVDVMHGIDILVHPADGESFGRIAVEAMAAGIPVVGVRGGGLAEIVVHGETGFLADVDDVAGIGRHIEQLLRDGELRNRFGAAGRRRAEEHFSLRVHGERMLEVYRRAMVMAVAK